MYSAALACARTARVKIFVAAVAQHDLVLAAAHHHQHCEHQQDKDVYARIERGDFQTAASSLSLALSSSLRTPIRISTFCFAFGNRAFTATAA